MALRVYDWDLVSADDFLGQAEVPFSDIDHAQVCLGGCVWTGV